MSKNNIVVVVDAMGGDYAPQEPVKAAVETIKENKNLTIKLVGQKSKILDELNNIQYDDSK